MTALDPVCSLKLSINSPVQYYGRGRRWNRRCTSFCVVKLMLLRTLMQNFGLTYFDGCSSLVMIISNLQATLDTCLWFILLPSISTGASCSVFPTQARSQVPVVRPFMSRGGYISSLALRLEITASVALSSQNKMRIPLLVASIAGSTLPLFLGTHLNT